MAQENSDNMQVVMGIIMQAGNAKAAAMQAIQAAKKGDFDKADEFIKQANEGLVNAHNVQTDMLTQEAQGNHVKVDLYKLGDYLRFAALIAHADYFQPVRAGARHDGYINF